MLYNILIRPIEYIIEVFFVVLYRFLGNEGWALIGLSIVISTLVLPLYARAEAIQEQERKKQKEMEHWLQHIRSVFCGDERYMIQNAYYQEQGYKPFYALKGTLSLLLQVPFFMAAYHFLSHLQMLQGCSFGMISDLGMEDGMLVINSYRVNILPILMTLINFVSSAIYTREYNWKQKLQPYVLAVVFLILLYRSPAGLVLYWTMNNVYSLIKNLVMGNERLKHKVFIGCSLVLVSCFVILLFVTGRVDHMIKGRKFEDAFIYGMVLLLFAMPVIKCFFPRKPKEIMLSSGTKTVFGGSILLLILLLGVAIPLTIIASAPEDFLLVDRTYSPLKYLVYTLSVSLGLFGFWGSVFFCMQKPEVKARFADVIFALGLYSVVNALFFQSFVGNITTVLKFDYAPKYSVPVRFLNLLIFMVFLVVVQRFLKDRFVIKKAVLSVMLFSLSIASTVGLYRATRLIRETPEIMEKDEQEHVIPFSRNGHNVVVLMLDRAISRYIPFMMEEKPILREQFAGFTYYPNTVSFGLYTNYGAPALYGGYEYTPEAINARADEKLEKKHDEALQVMPRLFGEQGFSVTVCDLPYVHYNEVMDTSFMQEYSYVNLFSMEDTYSSAFSAEEYREIRRRNFFFYSIYKVAPAMLQDEIYDGGLYLAADKKGFQVGQRFMDAYMALQNLTEKTVVDEQKNNTFFVMCNDTTHDPEILPLPDYDLTATANINEQEIGMDKVLGNMVLHFDQENLEYSVGHYHANMVAMLTLGKWFDQLRALGVYDNTRIILVADHGRNLGQFEDLLYGGDLDVMYANPLLMVKDFNSREFDTDWTFMTNADVPALASQDLISEPRNPYSGELLSTQPKEGGANILWEEDYDVTTNNGNVFLPLDAEWYHVENDIFKADNWSNYRK